MPLSYRGLLLATCLLLAARPALAEDETEKRKYYHEHIRPVLAKHCFNCHNGADRKGGLNLEDVFFINEIIRNGATWARLTDMVAAGEMPPSNKPRLTAEEKALVIDGINAFLAEALAEPDPGLVTMRRLSHREYRYSVLDLLGVDFDARAFFPADGSGGQGFDNHARVLYVTGLSFERYYEAAGLIVDSLYADPARWRRLVPRPYRPGLGERLAVWWRRVWHKEDVSLRGPTRAAEAVLRPLAARAYRRFPDRAEMDQLTGVFAQVYAGQAGAPDRFDRGIQAALQVMLISPHFLYRHEVDLPLARPYPLSGFEMASRLAYFLWSSLPDDALLDLAYRGDLHDPQVLAAQVRRMLADPRARRFSESFATQWLGIEKVLDTHEVDADAFPTFTPGLRRAMYDEAVAFFHHVLTERQTFLDLLDSDYAFVNETLAAHYGLARVRGDALVKVALTDRRRGGVLGLGGVLTATSLPTRTSPVVRGKWVLEQLLGTPPPPPPPDVPELEAAREARGELDLRALLTLHREAPACYGCHQKMDPIGLGLENFDGIGRWRDGYGAHPIDAAGVLADGTAFEGPAALKRVLLERKALFARNLSTQMLSYALGRDVAFQDRPTLDGLTEGLLATDFHTVEFITALVTSFPFRYRKSDPPES